MSSAKAKKKRQKQRQLDQKKKKSKLKEPIKKAEREARMLSKLKLAMVHLSNSYRAGKVTAHEDMDPGDEKALKALQRHTPPCEPTTSDSDMAVLKPPTPHPRKASSDSNTPRVEQRREMRTEIRALPVKKSPPSDVRTKTLISIKLQQSSVNLPMAAFSQVPPTASQRLVFCQGQLPRAEPQPVMVSAAVFKVLLKFSSPPEHSSKFDCNLPTKPNQSAQNLLLAHCSHVVMTRVLSVPLPQQTIELLQPQLDNQSKAKKPSTGNKNSDNRRKKLTSTGGWEHTTYWGERYRSGRRKEPPRIRSQSCPANSRRVEVKQDNKECFQRTQADIEPRPLLRRASESSLFVYYDEPPPPYDSENFAEAGNYHSAEQLIQSTAIFPPSKPAAMLCNPLLKSPETPAPILTARYSGSLQ